MPNATLEKTRVDFLSAPKDKTGNLPGCFDELIASLSSNPHVRGRQFEEIGAWTLREAPVYRNQIRQVWHWADFPYSEGIDDGIDLVAETNDGRFWAIQCKGYSPEYSIKKADLDSFISAAGKTFQIGEVTHSFSFRLLIASTDKLGTTAERCLERQKEPVGRLLRSDLRRLEEDGFSFPSSIQSLSCTERCPAVFAHPHQERAVSEVCSGLLQHTRGQLISACGTGKTLEALWVAERLKTQRILVACPSLSLIAQTLKAWNAAAKEPFEFKVVCSDESVVPNALEQRIERASELGVPVTTDVHEVRDFLSAKHAGRAVVFSTYQSLPVVAEAQHQLSHSFDLGIADEAHYLAGSGKGLFSRFLYDSEVKIDKRLFMTATPRIYSGATTRRLEELGLTCVDMDDKASFGPVLHQFSLREAIDREILSDYRAVIIGVRESELTELLRSELKFLTAHGETVDAQTLTAQVALLKAGKKYGLTRAVSFHSSIARAQSFSKTLPDVALHLGDGGASPWVSHVNGYMRTSNRLKILEQFASTKDGFSLISNCACLGEGVDLPSLDCVAFIDPRGSAVDVVQNVGRVVRKSPGKRAGTILIPVFLRDGEDPDALVESSRFAAVYETLRALRSHDPVLASALDKAARGGRGGLVFSDSFLAERIVIDLDPSLPLKIAEHINLRILQKVSVRQPLSESVIIEWAKAWNREHDGAWPDTTSGAVGDSIAPGEHWRNIHIALRDGHRGLPGGSGLPLLFHKHGLKPGGFEPLTEEKIVQWIKAWSRKHKGRWPNGRMSGPIGDDIAAGEAWISINTTLRLGLRGLPGKSSLTDLMVRHGLKKKRQNLTEDTIVTWARAWSDKHGGEWPRPRSGPVGDAIAPGEDWRELNNYLFRGTRGLPGGTTLRGLLVKRGLVHDSALTEDKILDWARKWSLEHKGELPARESGEISKHIAPGEKWINIDSALICGYRGLSGGSSLVDLLVRHKLIEDPRIVRPHISPAQILEWAKLWSAKHGGEWPTSGSGEIGSDIAPGETWRAVNAALVEGLRGLPGGSSLSQFLAGHGLKRNPSKLPPHTEERIVAWAKAWKAKHGKWPAQGSGMVGDDIAPGEKWSAINIALFMGARGLPGKSSLADLLERHNLKRNPQNLPKLNEEQIIQWAEAWKEKTGKWPTEEAGALGDEIAAGESWTAIGAVLRYGGRGLPGGTSVADLLDRYGLKRNPSNLPPVTEAQIVSWARAWSLAHDGDWPTDQMTIIGETIASGESWRSLDYALREGSRGLPGGSSLADLLCRHGLKANGELTEEKIIQWAKLWSFEHQGKWPTHKSGPIGNHIASGESWGGIHAALMAGRRGLKHRSGLRQLLSKARLI